jgi:Secretion system C-terminal sorting domain
VEDINGIKSNVKPAGAEASDPNIPYFIRVGYNLLLTDDFDVNIGNWAAGIPSDNATTGIWEYGVPVSTNVNGVIVQPNTQVTPGGSVCMFTGNATAGTTAGTNDVDGGLTTLELQGIDLTAYTNPAIEYYRWYSNDQGSTPGTDFWKVDISSDGGLTYIPVENTRIADHSWRNVVIRVNDYITPTANVWMRFIAEDANAGSLIEALVDEFSVYEQAVTGIENITPVTILNIFPNPAAKYLSLNMKLNALKGEIQVENVLGEIVYQESFNVDETIIHKTISTEMLSSGIYNLRIIGDKNIQTRKFVVSH